MFFTYTIDFFLEKVIEMEAAKYKGKNKSGIKQKFDDPELEAETRYAKENGYSPPRTLPSDSVKKIAEAFLNGTGKLHLLLF